MASLATAALMLLLYVPLAATHWVSIDIFAIHFAFFMMIPYGLGIIAGVREERRIREGVEVLEKGFHWIPGVIIVFFILLATVDSIIITFATRGVDGDLADIVLPESISGDAGEGVLSKFTGNVSYDLQDEEKKFDAYVQRLKDQKERGWKVDAGWLKSPVLNQASVFQVALQDKSGESIKGADVKLNFQRASQMALDHQHVLKGDGQGRYSKAITFPRAGCWQVQILISKDDDTHEVRGDTEVDELVDGKRIKRECVDGAPEMDTAR